MIVHLFRIFIFISSGVLAHAQSLDPDWNTASNRIKKSWGENNRAPKHVAPYRIEDVHSEDDLRPPYPLSTSDLPPPDRISTELLQNKVNDLKARVLEDKARVFESRARGPSGVVERNFSRLNISHLDRMGENYQLTALTYFLNGKLVYSFTQDSKPVRGLSFKVFDGFVPPGAQTIVVKAIYQGSGDGIFEYLSNYRVRVVDSKQLTTLAAHEYKATIEAREDEKIATSFQDRPMFVLNVKDGP